MSLINEGIDNGNGMNVSSFQSGLSYAAPDWSPPNERPIRDRLKPISLNPGDNDPIHLHSVLYFLEPTFFKRKNTDGTESLRALRTMRPPRLSSCTFRAAGVATSGTL